MTVKHVDSKKINGINHNGTYAPNQRIDILDDFFKKGGSIFRAPGVEKASGIEKNSNSSKVAEGKSLGDDAESRTAFSKDSIQKLKDSQNAIESGTQQAHEKNNRTHSIMKLAERTISGLIQKSEKTNNEIKALETEKASLPTDETSDDSSNNPFEAIYSLNMPGGAAGNVDNKGAGSLLSQDNQNTKGAQGNQVDQASGNEENQQRIVEIDSKIAAKKATLVTDNKTINKTVKSADNAYNNNLKQMALAARKAKQTEAVANAAKAKATGETMKVAQYTQAAGGAMVALGTATSAWGGEVLIPPGNYATAAGSLLGTVASAEGDDAQNTATYANSAATSLDAGLKKSKELKLKSTTTA